MCVGYSCEHSNSQLTPRLVVGLKKSVIVDVAASKYHSCALSSTGHLYTWGLNEGQLGHHAQASGSIQTHPKKVSLPSLAGDIVQVECTNFATCLLVVSSTNAREVHLLSNFESTPKRIQFPWTDPKVQSFGIKAHQKQERQMIDRIISGNQHFAALTNLGEVFLFSPPQIKHPTLVNVARVLETPQKVWTARDTFNAAKDFAIGIDCQLLVATKSGVCLILFLGMSYFIFG